MRVAVFLTFLLMGLQAHAEVRTFLLKQIEDRSPFGRFQAGDFSPGVKNFRTEPRCLIDDLKNTFKLQDPPSEIQIPDRDQVFKDAPGHPRTENLSLDVATFESALEDQLRLLLDLFNHDGDPVAAKRELCVSSGIFASPNAVSIGYGFMVFDPGLFFQIIRDENSNAYSLLAVVAHEFAHQLQVWHQDPTLMRTKQGRIFVRDKELQADCVAAAMMTRLNDQGSLRSAAEGSKIAFKDALFAAFASLGDFEVSGLESHHGTAFERTHMVAIGLQAGSRVADLKAISSDIFLKTCGTHITEMNKKFGDDLWPIGSALE